MGFLIGLIVTVVGFILALAVHPTHPGSVNVNTVGWIMVVVGLIAFFADLVLWSSWGPAYARRTYVEQGFAHGPQALETVRQARGQDGGGGAGTLGRRPARRACRPTAGR